MYKQTASFMFMIFLSIHALAQDSGFYYWNRYSWGTPEREGFTVLLPTIPEQIANEKGEQGISAVADFITYQATFKDGVGKKEFETEIENWMRFTGGGSGSGSGTRAAKEAYEREINMNRNTREISICGFSGIEFGNSSSVQQFFLVSNRLYHVWVTGANKSNPNVVKFFDSFSLAKPWDRWKGSRTNQNFEGLGTGSGSGTAFEITVCQNIGRTEIKKDPIKLPPNLPLRFISKPPPKYPEEAKKNQIQGTVTLEVTFLNDGTIGNVKVVKGVSKELDESAIKAAKLIRFEPQRRNGKYVTIKRKTEYNFVLY